MRFYTEYRFIPRFIVRVNLLCRVSMRVIESIEDVISTRKLPVHDRRDKKTHTLSLSLIAPRRTCMTSKDEK